jgi:hypothetical protein
MYASPTFSAYQSGVFSCSTEGQVNHAVLLIGYDSSGNWIIKNQYGVNWGINGYAVIDVNNPCSIGRQVYVLSEWKMEILVFLIIAILMI